jgi:preprotein translocase subunit SecA
MLETIFKSPTQQVLSKYKDQVDKINKLENSLKLLSDLDLKQKTTELKTRLLNGEPKSSIIPEAFALVREASRRVLGLRHFDVQLIGGLVLNEGNIAEMKTGEGKTLVALLPTFLNALYGKGAHVITVNDYLAKRDSEYVGQVHQFLGLTVGLIQEEMESVERKKNYSCDVTYVTNTQLGFDYLRDNMAYSVQEIVQRPFFYCVIDEVDSILIDEARTPLIISGAGEKSTAKYLQTTKLAKTLQKNIHYKVEEKAQNVILNPTGVQFCEAALGITNLYNPDEPWIFYILNSIKAQELFEKNKNYIVNENNEIVIVDEFTGRTMVGRRWSDGLHQAVEAKENLPIQDENQTLASISYQNLFLLYEQLSGMTGTAKTEEAEFEKIYNLNVITIPTNRPVIRKDLSDLIYKNQYIKWRCIAEECIQMHSIGRPVLIGTTTIEKSELLAGLLSEYQIPYRILNARPENVESESDIISEAGCKKAVTIATNMAGRGTDIILGGASKESGDEIINLGGLHVIGTERHESRRIDNQLRGRSGRQGDPGSSRFFLSLEDRILRIFGGEKILKIMEQIGFQDETPITSPILNNSLESAQKKVEAFYFDTRKQLFDYDQAINQQRNIVYTERKRIFEQQNLRDWLIVYADRSLYDLVNRTKRVEDFTNIIAKLQSLLGLPFFINFAKSTQKDQYLSFLRQQINITYDLKEIELECIEPGLVRELEKLFILQQIDSAWSGHLQKMSFLQDSIRWIAYGQKNPLTEYKKEAFNYFNIMLAQIRHRVVYFVFRSKIILF